MGSNGGEYMPMSEQMDGSEPTIEIKIKTLDSQTYTLKVDKEMPVPILKEQIASVTGVLSEQQRLICRGKVLKDDQLLSAYHVEDGHTLHLVVRQPIPLSSEGLPDHSATDPASSTSRGRSSVFIESFSVPVQGDGSQPDFSRFLSAVLGSVGIPNIASSIEGFDVTDSGTQRPERTSGLSGLFDLSQLLSEQTTTRAQPDGSNGTFGHSAAFSLGNLPLVIPDSLNTLSRYLSHIRRDFQAIARDGAHSEAAIHRNDESENSSSGSGIRREGIPSPASLAEVIRTARLLLIEQAGESLHRLASQLENQANVTDHSERLRTQASSLRTGALFHNLGACLLELGRTMLTLQMGQTPSDAVVNAGPAVFISPTGPNPIMVQPLPFQSGMSLGAIPMGALQPGSGLLNGLGSGFHPRRIDIQIRRGSPAATANVNQEEHHNLQQPLQRNSAPSSGGEGPVNQTAPSVSDGLAFAGDSGVRPRVVPIRAVVGSRLPSESAGSSFGLYYPFLGRFQHVASGNMNGEQESQSGDRRPAGLHTDRQSSENISDPGREGPTPNIRQADPPNGRSVSISFLSSGGTQSDQESERQVPSGILNLLRALFPGGEIHVEDGSVQGVNSSTVSDQARTSSGAAVTSEAEPRVSEEGFFLSNLLHQVMPIISQAATREPGLVPAEAENSPEHTTAQDSSTMAENSNVGTSRRHSQSDCDEPPSSKRQKKE
ncbi:ubiquitin-like domain-containing protein CIP73 [Argentina anserina]|uniref:ubiquitin-like domain-containing protein CIP73 n=1 Tax=Argentina anserina TaxID=57926 RepID=UPI0021768AC2|nr:ubiquitin-like domain-containing protein CIP73 [Potentilla anserina]XP_050364964.1 ubiquitin-like domain-containing protein CIP73 [Potentilla anserina]XP_050365042.1 ubiquitin-like domain-containing protein CIP73 [Potentilla anserina]